MASDYAIQSSQPRSAILPAVNQPIPRRQPRPRRLSNAIAKIAALEFLAVVAAAYTASFAYHYASSGSPPPAYQYVPAAIFIAMLVTLFSISFRHLEAVQTQPRHRFLWNGIGSVGLAFALFLSTMFLFKISEEYSRGSFIFQIVSVGIAVTTTRALAYSWLQSAIAAGHLAARRVVLIGDDALCTHFSLRLKATGILPVGSFP